MWGLLKTHGGVVVGAAGAVLGVVVGNWYAVAFGALLGVFYFFAVDYLHGFCHHLLDE